MLAHLLLQQLAKEAAVAARGVEEQGEAVLVGEALEPGRALAGEVRVQEQEPVLVYYQRLEAATPDLLPHCFHHKQQQQAMRRTRM